MNEVKPYRLQGSTSLQLVVVSGVLVMYLSTVGVGHSYFFQVHFTYRAFACLGVGFITFALHRACILLRIGYLLHGGRFGGSSVSFAGTGASKQCAKRQNKKYLFHIETRASRSVAFGLG